MTPIMSGKSRPFRKVPFISLFFIVSLFVQTGAAAKSPNILLIFIDDQGYNDLGVFGSPDIKTPNIDGMAAEGARFTDFYSAANVCTPSRAALMTGCYARRVNMNNVLFPRDNVGLNPNEITIADLMKRKGYNTACIGKWHLGHLVKFLPISNGFDYYYGIPYSNDMEIARTLSLDSNIVLREGYTMSSLLALLALPQADIRSQTINKVPLLRNDKVIEYPVDQSTLTQRYAGEAIRFIVQSLPTGRPFFVYLATTMPHIPLFMTPEFQGSSDQGPYGDCIQEIDFNVGRILDTLANLGLDSNTLIIYTTDNGPWNLSNNRGGSADPLRGFKFDTWEGGHRVPTVMRWPGQIPAGMVQSEMASTIDLLPTLAYIAGVPLPVGETIEGEPWIIDGVNIWDLIRGTPGASRDMPFFYQRANNPNFEGVRLEEWKLRNGALYDLSTDIHEDNDVSGANAAKANELQGLLDGFVTEITANDRPQGNTNTPDPVAGCTFPEADNYNEDARQDDGSCNYPVYGCMDSNYVEYDSGATAHDSAQCLTLGTGHRAPFAAKGIRLRYRSGSLVVTVQTPGTYVLKVFDLNGSQVLNRELSGGSNHQIALTLPAGMYRATVSSGRRRIITHKFTVL